MCVCPHVCVVCVVCGVWCSVCFVSTCLLYAHARVYMWVPEVVIWYLFKLLFTLLFERECLIEPRAH